jgi:hypothetical protein
MVLFSNTQVLSNCDRHNCAEKNLLRSHLGVANLAGYHSLRDAHGNESSNFSIATFGQ